MEVASVYWFTGYIYLVEAYPQIKFGRCEACPQIKFDRCEAVILNSMVLVLTP
jgi:hypothetical protein